MTLTYVALANAMLGLLLLALAGPFYRVGLPLDTAFSMMRWGAYVGAVGLTLGLITAYLTYQRKQRIPLSVSVVASILSVLAVAVPAFWQWRASRVPPIHDVTTDLQNPPAFSAIVPLRQDAPNPLERAPIVADQQRRGYPEIVPITMSLPPDRVFNRSLDVAQRMGWEIVASDQAAGRIEATATTFWFGFEDDVVVRTTPWGSGTRVDVRSVSRVGRSDGGTNARRIRQFLDALQNE